MESADDKYVSWPPIAARGESEFECPVTATSMSIRSKRSTTLIWRFELIVDSSQFKEFHQACDNRTICDHFYGKYA